LDKEIRELDAKDKQGNYISGKKKDKTNYLKEFEINDCKIFSQSLGSICIFLVEVLTKFLLQLKIQNFFEKKVTLKIQLY
jgi:hypothetical protein